MSERAIALVGPIPVAALQQLTQEPAYEMVRVTLVSASGHALAQALVRTVSGPGGLYALGPRSEESADVVAGGLATESHIEWLRFGVASRRQLAEPVHLYMGDTVTMQWPADRKVIAING